MSNIFSESFLLQKEKKNQKTSKKKIDKDQKTQKLFLGRTGETSHNLKWKFNGCVLLTRGEGSNGIITICTDEFMMNMD